MKKLVLLAGSSKLCNAPVGLLSAGLWNNFSFRVFGSLFPVVNIKKNKLKEKTLASHIISAFLSGLSASVK